jgi:hypothetical protein
MAPACNWLLILANMLRWVYAQTEPEIISQTFETHEETAGTV